MVNQTPESIFHAYDVLMLAEEEADQKDFKGIIDAGQVLVA